MYTADLEDHVAEHKVSFHAFADDTQLFVQCRRDDVMSAVRRLENCIDDVSNVLVDIYIMRSSQVDDLSLDKVQRQVVNVVNIRATCFYWLRQLRQVRRSLDVESAATLVHAFVTSRLDYCNAILAGHPSLPQTSSSEL